MGYVEMKVNDLKKTISLINLDRYRALECQYVLLRNTKFAQEFYIA